jgi:hypothetical protein
LSCISGFVLQNSEVTPAGDLKHFSFAGPSEHHSKAARMKSRNIPETSSEH